MAAPTPSPPSGSSTVTKLIFFLAIIVSLIVTTYGGLLMGNTLVFATGLPGLLIAIGALYHAYFDPGA